MKEYKTCTSCKQEKTIDLFGRNKRKLADGSYTSYVIANCKACHNARAMEWKAKNPEAHKLHKQNCRARNRDKYRANGRLHLLKYKYNLSLLDYESLRQSQGNVCAICGSEGNQKNNSAVNFCVDHDHESGIVRGLLCHFCNRALGFFKDDIARLEAAIKYLTDPPNSARLRDTGTPSDTV